MDRKTRDRATGLYFKIEMHFALGGRTLTYRDIATIMGAKRTNTGLACHYIKILERWKLIEHKPHTARSIRLLKTNFPPVEWRHIHIKGLQ